ncbi:MAG: DUF5050 domain-containing protein [Oscillospiraceae bacterium]|jgi:hypothetical protein|nr:DUF5050 domain-containing protein [Oscillospiraceae bacterium]
MRRIILFLLVAVALIAPLSVSAELTNGKIQQAGGLIAVNSKTTYFFSLMGSFEENKWGLFSVDDPNTMIAEVSSIEPSRFLYADNTHVYFVGMRPDDALMVVQVELATGKTSPLFEKLTFLSYESESTFFYTNTDDKYTLYRYSFETKKSTNLKKMTTKLLYDASFANDQVYMLVSDTSKPPVLYLYQIDKRSNKATQMDAPNPKLGDAFLAGNRIVYNQRGDTTRIYTLELGKTKATRLGEKITALSLFSPYYAGALYPYDAASSSLIRVPIDASAPTELTITTANQARFVLGGTEDLLYFLDDGKIFSVSPDLTNKQEVAQLDVEDDGMIWTTIMPTNKNSLILMGYIPVTAAKIGSVMPTSLKIIDIASGEVTFEYPVPDTTDAPVADITEESSEDPVDTEITQDDGEQYDDIQIGDNEDVSFEDLGGN